MTVNQKQGAVIEFVENQLQENYSSGINMILIDVICLLSNDM